MTTLEAKIVASLTPHRTTESRNAVEQLASSIAFIIRYKLGPDVASNQVSVLKAAGRLAIIVHQGPERMKCVVSISIGEGKHVITALTEIMDRAVLDALRAWDPTEVEMVSLLEEVQDDGRWEVAYPCPMQ